MNTTNTSLKVLSHLLLMLMMICNPISVIFSQQTITSDCGDLTRIDVHVRGIQNRNTDLPIGLDNGTNRVTMECVCRDVNTGPCPNTITFTIRKLDGTIINRTATGFVVNIDDDDRFPSKMYRVIYNGTTNRVTYNVPSPASRPSMRGLVVWQESVGGIPNIPNNRIVDRFFYQTPNQQVYNITVPRACEQRDFLVRIPVHEHGNNGRPIEYQVRAFDGNTQRAIVNRTVTANNAAAEIRLDQIALNNVPANVNRIQVRIQSVAPNGSSVVIGSIMATSTPCYTPTLTCPSNITRSTDAGRCDYTVQGAELNPTFTQINACPITLSNSYNGNSTLAGATFPVGTTVVTWSASNIVTCQVTITVQDNEAPVLICPSDTTITAEAGICEALPEFTLPSASDNCGAIVTCNPPLSDAFPIGTTPVTCTATDAAGNTDTCTFDVTVVQCDTCVTTLPITHIDDNDINIGTNDMESVLTNPLYRFLNPGLPTVGVLTNVTLELYFRVFGMSCEDEIEVHVTDPMGNTTIFKLFSTCNRSGLHHIVLDLPDVPLEGDSVGEWHIEFRDTNDQNIGAAEYSTRFARLIYDATFDECYNTERISTYNENELLSELSEVRLYPVPTSSVLNMEYTSDEDTDLSIEIIDGNGRIVGTQKESVISGVNTFNMNVDGLAQGIYYMRIMDNVGRMQVKPFTKITP